MFYTSDTPNFTNSDLTQPTQSYSPHPEMLSRIQSHQADLKESTVTADSRNDPADLKDSAVAANFRVENSPQVTTPEKISADLLDLRITPEKSEDFEQFLEADMTPNPFSGGFRAAETTQDVGSENFSEADMTQNPFSGGFRASETTQDVGSENFSEADMTQNPFSGDLGASETTQDVGSENFSEADLTQNPFSGESRFVQTTPEKVSADILDSWITPEKQINEFSEYKENPESVCASNAMTPEKVSAELLDAWMTPEKQFQNTDSRNDAEPGKEDVDVEESPMDLYFLQFGKESSQPDENQTAGSDLAAVDDFGDLGDLGEDDIMGGFEDIVAKLDAGDVATGDSANSDHIQCTEAYNAIKTSEASLSESEKSIESSESESDSTEEETSVRSQTPIEHIKTERQLSSEKLEEWRNEGPIFRTNIYEKHSNSSNSFYKVLAAVLLLVLMVQTYIKMEPSIQQAHNSSSQNDDLLDRLQQNLDKMGGEWEDKLDHLQSELPDAKFKLRRPSKEPAAINVKSTIAEPKEKKVNFGDGERDSRAFVIPGHEEWWFNELAPPGKQREPFWKHFQNAFRGRNFTANFMRQTRSIIGNVERLRLYLQKLKSGKCTTTMVLGGSVSAGTNVLGISGAYQTHFNYWLNARYPCTGGEHVMLYPKGPQTSSVVDGFPELVDDMKDMSIDLILVEYGPNDPFAGDTWLDRMDQSNKRLGTQQESLEWMTELLVRRLLYIRKYKNRSPAIVYVECSLHYRDWPWHEGWDTNQFHFMEQGHSGAWGHHPVLQYYGIPTIDIIGPAISLWMGSGGEGEAKKTGFFDGSDPCCHPAEFFHQITGLAIAFHFQQEMDWLDHELTYHEQDFTMQNPPIMRPPWRLTKRDNQKYVVDYIDAQLDKVTYWNFLRAEPAAEVIGENEGFTFYSDTRKNKTGMIATKVGSHISFKINVMDNAPVIIGYLTTYENISPANVWFDDLPHVKDSKLCETPSLDPNTGEPKRVVNPLLTGGFRVSVYGSQLFDKLPHSGEQFLHVCLLPLPTGWSHGTPKFKILKVIF